MDGLLIDDVRRRLHEQGERLTDQRAQLIEVFANCCGPMTVDDIRVALDAGAAMHRSTIYRNVEVLHRHGILSKTMTPTGKSVYALDPTTVRRMMAQCKACGAFIELPWQLTKSWRGHITQQTGFEVHPCHVILPGLCAQCRSL